jgi:hypothetical protein
VRYGYRAEGAVDLLDMYERTRGEGFGLEVKRRIMIGTYALSAGYYDAYYGRAQRVRTLVRRDFERAFAEVDLIASPTSPTVAFAAGSRTDDPLAMYMSDVCTIPANLAGLPAISIPCGLSDGLPVGFQLTQRLEASTSLSLPPGVIESQLCADPCRELASVQDGVVLKEPDNVGSVRRRGQRSFNLVLSLHAGSIHSRQLIVQ